MSTAIDPRGPTDVRAGRSNFWRNRHLIWVLAQRDLQVKYKTTVLGWLWSMLVPIATVVVYTVVFSLIFRAAPPELGNGEPGVFAIWFFIGLIVFTMITTGMTQSAAAMLGIRSLLQKVYFPSYVSTASSVLGLTIQAVIELGVVLAILLVFGMVSWTWLLLPFFVVGLAVFTFAVGLMVAIANAHLRDIAQMLPVITRLLFFASPIIYTMEMVPERLGIVPIRTLIELNPVTTWITIARDLLYSTSVPSLATVAYAATWTAAVAGLAVLVYRRWGQDIGETS